MPNPRDEFPDYAERVRRMPDLIAAPALPIADVAILLDIPLSTIDKLRAQGRGPKCFLIGRRLYTRQSDLREWFDRLADEQNGGPHEGAAKTKRAPSARGAQREKTVAQTIQAGRHPLGHE